jgi:hypothetical protein
MRKTSTIETHNSGWADLVVTVVLKATKNVKINSKTEAIFEQGHDD